MRALSLLALATVACTGNIGNTIPVPPTPLVVKSSVTRALSNHEFASSVALLSGAAVPYSMFADWTATTQYSGFDGIIWTGLDDKAVQDRAATVEQLANMLVSAPRVMNCTDGGDYGCAGSIIESFATRAFRRPLADDERSALAALYQAAFAAAAADAPSPVDQFYEGVRVVLSSVLLSPQFLLRLEPPPSDGERDLDPYELATRLAYLVTGAIPDDALWQHAVDGSISDVSVLASETDRLLDTYPDAFARTFTGQLFDFRQLDTAAADSLKSAFFHESTLVFRDILSNDLPATSMLQPGFTYVNPLLADNYGMPAPDMSADDDGDGFVRVDTGDRGGILEQGSVLSITSTMTATSPTRRGRWVQSRLLCKTIPPPGPELLAQIAQVSSSIPADASVKERVDAHKSAGAACMGCHQYMDPIGLGLEGFDQFGRNRSVYADGKPVETDSDLLGTPFANFDAMNALLIGMPDVNACMAQKLVIFGLGQMIADTDQPLIDFLSAPEDKHDPTLRTLVRRLVTSDPFRRIAAPQVSQ